MNVITLRWRQYTKTNDKTVFLENGMSDRYKNTKVYFGASQSNVFNKASEHNLNLSNYINGLFSQDF